MALRAERNTKKKRGIKMSIKISIAAARINAGLTQKEVCKTLNISKTTLVSYEKGRTVPDVIMGQKLADLYNIPIDNLKFF